MGLTEILAESITKLIEKGGYLSVTLCMTLESMVFPVPSEAVMPFAGFLVAENTFNFWYVVFFSTLGSIIGSLISYTAGYYGGKPCVHKFGKYVFLNNHHLEYTENFFKKYGDATIFVCRFIPVVRHLISIPAGVGKMNIFKFIFLTIAGAAMWNAFLCWIGRILRSNWQEVMKYSKILDIIVVIAILSVIGYLISLRFRKKEA